MNEFLRTYNLLFLALAICIIPIVFYSDFYKKRSRFAEHILLVLFALSFIILFGLRSYDVGTDTRAYVDSFQQLKKANGFKDAWDMPTSYGTKDPLFNILTYCIGLFTNAQGYLFSLSCLLVIPVVLCASMFTRTYRIMVFFGFIGLIAFPNMGINVVRVGVALSFSVLSIALFYREKKLLAFTSMILGILFHLSSLVVFLTFGIVYLLKRLPVIAYYLTFIVTAVAAYSGIGIEKLPIVKEYVEMNERLANYAENAETNQAGFSMFTLLYNAIIIAVGGFAHYKLKENAYDVIFKTFIALTCFYFLCLNMPYSYRFSFYAAVLIPLVIAYPFIRYQISKNFQLSLLYCILFFLGFISLFRTFTL